MKFSETTPFVRFAGIVPICPEPTAFCARDHRLFYVLKGRSRMLAEGEEFLLAPGTMVLIPAGCRYSMLEKKAISFISVNFDYTAAHADLTDPLPPIPADEFQESDPLEKLDFTDYPLLNGPICLYGNDKIREDLYAVMTDLELKKRLHREMVSARMKLVLTQALHTRLIGRRACGAIDTVISYIRENYMHDVPNRILGELTGYHVFYLNRLMQEETGMPLHRYLVYYRINMAKHLLIAGDLPANLISEQTGFSSPSAFSACFKKHTGLTPAEFRSHMRCNHAV